MSITRETITFTCPSCGHTTRRHTVIESLAGGKKPVCEKCGTEIIIDREVLTKIEEILQRLGIGDSTGITTETDGAVSVRCPHCGTSASVSPGLQDLGKRDTVFCQNCGREIPIDRDGIRSARHGFDVLSAAAGDAVPTPGAPAPSGSTVIKPKRGCLGGMLVLASGAAAFLVYALM
jgi:transcription elongation factor Elf1